MSPVTPWLRLSAAQLEVWTAQELDPADPQFVAGGYVDIVGPFRPDLLDHAVDRVVTECEALQVEVGVDGSGDGPAVGLAATTAPLLVVDLSGHASPVGSALDWMRSDLARPVVMARDPLFRHALFPVGRDRHLFYFRYHHLLLDGFGQVLYWRRVATVYSALARGVAPPCSPFGSLAELATEDAAYRASAQAEQDRDHWLAAMAEPPEPDAPTQVPGPARGVLRTLAPAGTAMRELHRAAAARGTHWSVILITALAAYVRRTGRHDDIVLGFPVRARVTRTA